MTPDRWQRIERLYHDALAREERERAAFLHESCGGDAALQHEVESLLAYANTAPDFLKSDALDAALMPPAGDVDHGLLAPGTTLGSYTIVALLGIGGMGEVYRARDARLGRVVALKRLPDRVTRDPDAIERFVREARAASALNHPNIVTIHEVGESDAGRFLIMELVEGRTLRAISAAPFSMDVFVRIATQMARALAVAHAAGIIHRDIKPENVMVRDDGYVKLLDFGLARLMPSSDVMRDEPTTPRTAAGIAVGTSRYMSPEQARGETLTPASDIYSLGIVFYELATRQHPFAAGSHLAVLHGILTEAAQSPSRFNREIPKRLDALIEQMLHKDARLRPTAADVEIVLNEIAGAASTVSTSAAPDVVRNTVGRKEERAELHAAFAAASRGQGLLVCVAGEPGIGKTTLVEDFLLELAGRPCSIARGKCSERLAGAEAYLPWLEALETLLRADSAGTTARMMKLLAPAWYLAVAPLAAADVSSAAGRAAAPPVSQDRMKRELTAFLEELTRLRPLALFLDDVHWADESTIDVLTYVAGRFEALAVLIVATYRPSELQLAQHPFLRIKRELQARGVCREIAVSFLTVTDVERYLALELPEHRRAPDLAAIIHARTEGNPLFMADLVRHLRETQLLGETGGWVRDLPASVRSMIQTKIAQLSESDHRLLSGSSVQGAEFDSAVVAKALALDPADVEERLEVLERVHAFVRLVREAELPNRTLNLRYRFVHVLYQNTLYASLRPTRKAALSAAIADALLAGYGKRDAAIAPELAVLFETARDFARAADYFQIAAQQASRMSAHKEAVVLARRGLDAIQLLPDSPDRAERELRLLTTLGPALMTTSGFGTPEAEAVSRRARELSQHVTDSPQLFAVIWGSYQYSLATADYRTAMAQARRLLAPPHQPADGALLILANHAMANTCAYAGEFETSVRHAELEISMYNRREHHALTYSYTGYDPGATCRCGTAVVLWRLGYPDRALALSREGIAMARELAHISTLALCLAFDAQLQLHCGDVARALASADEAIALAGEEFGPWLAFGLILRGSALGRQQRADEGIAHIWQGLGGLRAGGVRCLEPYFLELLADAQQTAGLRQEALAAVDEAIAITAQTQEGWAEAEVHRVRGELLEDADEAERSFQQAIAVARRQQAKSFELSATLGLYRLHARQGDGERVRDQLEQIYAWFTEGFETSDLKEAAARLRAP